MALFDFDPANYPDQNREQFARKFPDYGAVNTMLAEHLADFVPFVPGAFVKGDELHTLNPMRDDKHIGSFSVNRQTGKWYDHALGRGGRPLDLFAGFHRILTDAAAKLAVEVYGLPSGWEEWKTSFSHDTGPKTQCKAVAVNRTLTSHSIPAREENRPKWAPAPAGAKPLFLAHHGKEMHPKYIFRYETANGELAYFIGRFEFPGTPKFFIPAYYTEAGTWANADPEEFKGRRPLFNLPQFAHSVDLPVLLVEGEKKADAAARMPHGAVVSTWAYGAGSEDRTDFRPLAGHPVILWPDNDTDGLGVMVRVAERLRALGCRVFTVLIPKGKPNKWDAWDCLKEDPTGQAGAQLVLACVRVE